MGNRSSPRVFVSVGTDHHPFDRLVRWVDAWAGGRGVPCVIQHGSSAAPGSVEAIGFMSPAALSQAMSEASVVVTHGGPGTIAAARDAGRLPIVVARDPALGEHVDDHQQRFVSRMHAEGLLVQVRTQAELHGLLDRAVADPRAFVVEPGAGKASEASERFGELVEAMVAGRRPEATRSAPSGAAESLPPVTVLFIGGAGRSGSTLLDRLLGRRPGFVSAGEVVHLWRRGLLEDQLCGCGERFSDCPFWQKVGQLGFDGWDNVDPTAMLARQHEADRNRYIAAMKWPSLLRRRASHLDAYRVHLASLYRAIADAADAQVVVDSSKHPSTAFLLSRTGGIDLRLVHLVRDPRGVVHSTSRKVRRPEVVDRSEYMPNPGPVRSAAEWLAYNLLFDRLRASGSPSVLVRYEDLVEDPSSELDRVLTILPGGLPPDGPAADTMELPAAHTVSGNPMRFERGPLKVRSDDEWRTRLPGRDRRVVEALAWPLMSRYGYERGRA